MVETDAAQSETTAFLWDGTDLVLASAGSTVKRYFAQGEVHGEAKLFYVQDRLGSVRETVNEKRLITSRMDYTAYGETETKLTPKIGMAPDYRYAGLYYHEQSELYLAAYRAYAPEVGRWINRDPIGEDGGINLFGYVNGDPVNKTDPFGLYGSLGTMFNLNPGEAEYLSVIQHERSIERKVARQARPLEFAYLQLVLTFFGIWVPGLNYVSAVLAEASLIDQICQTGSENPVNFILPMMPLLPEPITRYLTDDEAILRMVENSNNAVSIGAGTVGLIPPYLKIQKNKSTH